MLRCPLAGNAAHLRHHDQRPAALIKIVDAGHPIGADDVVGGLHGVQEVACHVAAAAVVVELERIDFQGQRDLSLQSQGPKRRSQHWRVSVGGQQLAPRCSSRQARLEPLAGAWSSGVRVVARDCRSVWLRSRGGTRVARVAAASGALGLKCGNFAVPNYEEPVELELRWRQQGQTRLTASSRQCHCRTINPGHCELAFERLVPRPGWTLCARCPS